MKNRSRSIKALALTAILMGSATACGGPDTSSVAADCEANFEFPTISEGKLTIATLDAPPYYSGVGAQATGIDKDVLDQFAKDACLETVYNTVPSASVVESVAGGRADVAAGGWYATDERAQIVNQTDPSYIELPTFIAKSEISDIEQIKSEGLSVGTITGYAWVEDVEAYLGNVKLYQSADAVLADVEAGRIDVGMTGGIDAPYLVKEKGLDLVSATMDPNPAVDSSVNPSLPNYPNTKGNGELTAALNEELTRMHEDGFIADALEQFGVDPALADVDSYNQG